MNHLDTNYGRVVTYSAIYHCLSRPVASPGDFVNCRPFTSRKMNGVFGQNVDYYCFQNASTVYVICCIFWIWKKDYRKKKKQLMICKFLKFRIYIISCLTAEDDLQLFVPLSKVRSTLLWIDCWPLKQINFFFVRRFQYFTWLFWMFISTFHL